MISFSKAVIRNYEEVLSLAATIWTNVINFGIVSGIRNRCYVNNAQPPFWYKIDEILTLAINL